MLISGFEYYYSSFVFYIINKLSLNEIEMHHNEDNMLPNEYCNSNNLNSHSKQPQTRDGVDSFGGLGATLVDSLDTLYIMGLDEQFQRAREWVSNCFNLSPPQIIVSPYIWLTRNMYITVKIHIQIEKTQL